MGFVYDSRFQPSNEPILEVKYGHAYYHSLFGEDGKLMAYMTINDTVTAIRNEENEVVRITAYNKVSDSRYKTSSIFGNRIITDEGTEARVEGYYNDDDVRVAAAALLVSYQELLKIRDAELIKNDDITKTFDMRIVPDEKNPCSEDILFYKSRMEKALSENDRSAESVFYIINKDSINDILNTEQSSESLFLRMLSLSGFNPSYGVKTRNDGYTLSADGIINIDRVQTNLNLMADRYTDGNTGTNGIPDFNSIKNEFKRSSFGKKPENEYAIERGYYIRSDGNEYLDEELMKKNRYVGKFCDGIVGAFGIPFDLKTDFDYPDRFKSDRNPSKRDHFYYEGLDDKDRAAFKKGYYGGEYAPYISEPLRHYNVLTGRFVNGDNGRNGFPQIVLDYNKRASSNRMPTDFVNNTPSKIKSSTFWNKRLGWGIWISVSLLSLLIIPAIYAFMKDDLVTGIALWIVIQIFSIPGYVVAFFDFKDKLKKPYAVILIFMGGVVLGFLTYVYIECLISFIGLVATFIIRILSPDDGKPIGQITQYHGNQTHPNEIIGEVDKTAYILLALFLGSLGIHRFYAGKILSGFVYLILVFLMISPLLALIDAAVAIGSPRNEYGKLYVYKDRYFV